MGEQLDEKFPHSKLCFGDLNLLCCFLLAFGFAPPPPFKSWQD